VWSRKLNNEAGPGPYSAVATEKRKWENTLRNTNLTVTCQSTTRKPTYLAWIASFTSEYKQQG